MQVGCKVLGIGYKVSVWNSDGIEITIVLQILLLQPLNDLAPTAEEVNEPVGQSW